MRPLNLPGSINVVVRQANTGRGSEFYSNKKNMNPGSESDFERYLVSVGCLSTFLLGLVILRLNGKLERHWREYVIGTGGGLTV